ncbi:MULTISPECIES: ORF6C domain-containing protein [unclassified Blautia]|jgi:prophage antirepressor-like protein|uniref:ORF6C domain-containing protein n=1 Tax=unclassified Blautia TaxID=2648079 RepID=UPI001FD19407|nr:MULTISPECIES: ORF6C domain-containing protein [unclassified Blautia]MCJ7860403.1 ORF6C domain-containing protein [Blautia sp. NSJ-157]MCJ7863746.1 ORF6C domain-containing protein [Blautia sp. NSJ-140]DAV29392.1 MAG TPA: repressor domain protein [Caudoviricetes sp.]
MNELQIFNSGEFGEIRTIEIDGKPYFVGTDVAKALGYSNPRKAILDHCKGVTKRDTPTSSGIQSMSYINEGDLYRLIMKSKLPSAEKFESWVMDEVLPTIRKTGSYQKPLTTVEQIQVIATGFLDHEERLNRLENTMTIDYAQQESIRDLVSSVVIAHLGGKESNAYKEIGKKVFAECNRDIKTYFAVNARNNIPKLRFKESMEYVKNWHPCTNTVMMIRDCNAQMSIS